MMAMLKLWKSDVLRRLGWKLLLQIHDEVILEGPKESRDEAMREVRAIMEQPFDNIGLSKLKGMLLHVCVCTLAVIAVMLFMTASVSIFLSLVHLDVDAKSADSWYKAK